MLYAQSLVRLKRHESLDQGSKTFLLSQLYTWEWPKQSVDSRERSIQRVKDVRLLKASHSHTRSYVNQWKSWGKSRTLLHLPRKAQSKRLSAIQTRCKFQSLSRTLSLARDGFVKNEALDVTSPPGSSW